jgi:hypothetical protein
LDPEAIYVIISGLSSYTRGILRVEPGCPDFVIYPDAD